MRLTEIGQGLAAARAAGTGAVTAVVVANRSSLPVAPGARVLVVEGQSPAGSIAPDIDRVVVDHALSLLREKRSRLQSFAFRDDRWEFVGIQGGDIDVFFDVLARPPRLVVVGAGHIALPLAEIGRLAAFEIVVIDDRPEFASRERFPHADQILVGPYTETLASVQADSDTYIVLVTRGHVHDRRCLELVIDSPAAYIGMIGSKRRVATVWEHLRAEGVRPELLERVHAPIGLDIGAETPAEIAIAVMAEIVSVRRARKPAEALQHASL